MSRIVHRPRHPYPLSNPLVAAVLVTLGVLFAAAQVLAAESTPAQAPVVTVTLENHRFTPTEILAPAGVRFTLVVTNKDQTAEEIESSVLKIEKIVRGGKEIKLPLGPLAPGRYPVVGEYHEDTARAEVVVK